MEHSRGSKGGGEATRLAAWVSLMCLAFKKTVWGFLTSEPEIKMAQWGTKTLI